MSDPAIRLNAALEGRYAIERELGEGGMATVYLADDIKHQRKVALKVLKPELAAVVGAERFLAEIKTTANLTHPHILPLHDSGEADGFLFYVMPHIEGESLRERIDREKQLPVDEAVKIATDLAEALDYAHRHKIIHRDIKPANILIHEGRPLIADFGIALAVGVAGGGRLTETGLSVGTPHYMSPEQATGDQAVGVATDIYALGAVLYEMLIGDPPYMGSTAQAILGRIIAGKVASATEERASVPANVDAAIRKALEKLPADRFTEAQAFAGALRDPGFRHGNEILAVVDRVGLWKPLAIGMTATAVGLAALLVLGPVRFRAAESPRPVVRTFLELPSNTYLLPNPQLALADDGSVLVVTARVDGRDMLIQHRLDVLDDFRVIEGEEYAGTPVISPDGQALAFAKLAGLHQVPLEGGATVEVVTGPTLAGDWATDGTIYYTLDAYTPGVGGGIWGVSSDGGVPYQITSPDTLASELSHLWPQLLPDGEHLLFTAYRTPVDSSRIMAVSMSTGEVSLVQERATYGRYSRSGHLLFARGAVLYAAPFDSNRRTTSGAAQPVVDGIAVSTTGGFAAYALSEDGTLVYVSSEDLNVPRQLVSLDRMGNEQTQLPIRAGLYEGPALSPDGASLAVAVREPGELRDVIVIDLIQGRSVPLAQGPGDEFAPIWTTDGERVVYVCEARAADICARAPNSSDPPTVLLSSDFDKQPYSFTADGSRLIVAEEATESRFLSVSLTEFEAAPDTLLQFGNSWVSALAVAPDDRWIAYVSDETGEFEVWVQSLDPSVTRRYPISSGGGFAPLWTKNGRELVYRLTGSGVFAVPFDPVTGEAGAAELLFVDTYYAPDWFWYREWDVTPDGERFILSKEPEDRLPRRLIVVSNFFEELRRRVPN